MSKKLKEIRILEDVTILIEPKESQLIDIYGQDEQARLSALYHEMELQKEINNYLNNQNIQNGNY